MVVATTVIFSDYKNLRKEKRDLLTPSELMFRELKWLSFPKWMPYRSFTTMYKALNGLVHEIISDVFTRNSMAHCRNLRIPISKTNFYEISFTISAAKFWNAIPPYILLSSKD